MSQSVQILHNPRCSKSRQTLALLQASGIEPEIIEYLKTPPSAEQLLEIARMLGQPLDACLRHKEAEYKTHIAGQSLSDSALAELVHQYPKTLERPVVICDGRAKVGRPPEQVLELFSA